MYKGKYLAGAVTDKPKKAAAPVIPEEETAPVLPEEATPVISEEAAKLPQEAVQDSDSDMKDVLPLLEDIPPAAPEAAPKSTPKKALRHTENKKAKKREKSKRSKKATIIFYSIFAFVILAMFVAIFIAMNALDDFLLDFEAAQPDVKAEQTFQERFADPDWGSIYDQAGLQSQQYGDKATFVDYMENKLAGCELTYVKTSAGLTGGSKYIVKNGTESLLTFTLKNAVESETEIPDWQFDSVEVLITVPRNEYVSVLVAPDNTVTVNGTPLDDTYVIMTTSTEVDEYLPEGLKGPGTALYYMDGFISAPTVTVTDTQGQEVALTYDAESRTYTQADLDREHTLPEGVEGRMVSAVHAFGRKMINAGGNVSSYFDTSSQIYQSILKNEMWFKGASSYEFTPEVITSPYVYSDTLISAHISLVLKVTRSSNGTVKDFPIDRTIFMEKKSNGKWQIIDMNNKDLLQERTQVRLTFLQDGNVLESTMVDTKTNKLTLPAVTVPEGMEFVGWAVQTTDENGKTQLNVKFQPDENNEVMLPQDYVLEPMKLVAAFQKAGA